MKLQSYKNDNLFNWQGIKVETNGTTEVFGLVKFKRVEPMDKVESELDAIEKMIAIKEFHRENGVKKSDSYYYYFKLQMIELNDMGLRREEEHLFKDSEGHNLVLILN